MGTKLTPTFGWDDLPDYRAWRPKAPNAPDAPPNVPVRASLLEPGVEGENLIVSGRVLTLNGAPLANVKLEFWQADAAGKYDEGIRLRGIQRTDAEGRFRLETILPGYSGPIRHINYLATAVISGRKQPFHLCAAIYFATDHELKRPVSPAERDYVRSGAKIHRDDSAFLALSATPVENGIRRASYDIVFDVA